MTKTLQRLSFVALAGMAGAAMWFGASSPGLDPIEHGASLEPEASLPDGIYAPEDVLSPIGRELVLPALKARGFDVLIVGKSNILRAAVRERSEK